MDYTPIHLFHPTRAQLSASVTLFHEADTRLAPLWNAYTAGAFPIPPTPVSHLQLVHYSETSLTLNPVMPPGYAEPSSIATFDPRFHCLFFRGELRLFETFLSFADALLSMGAVESAQMTPPVAYIPPQGVSRGLSRHEFADRVLFFACALFVSGSCVSWNQPAGYTLPTFGPPAVHEVASCAGQFTPQAWQSAPQAGANVPWSSGGVPCGFLGHDSIPSPSDSGSLYTPSEDADTYDDEKDLELIPRTMPVGKARYNLRSRKVWNYYPRGR